MNITANNWIIVNNEFKGMSKDMVMTSCEILSKHVHGGTEENHKTSG
jgi:hypothetical protein